MTKDNFTLLKLIVIILCILFIIYSIPILWLKIILFIVVGFPIILFLYAMFIMK